MHLYKSIKTKHWIQSNCVYCDQAFYLGDRETNNQWLQKLYQCVSTYQETRNNCLHLLATATGGNLGQDLKPPGEATANVKVVPAAQCLENLLTGSIAMLCMQR